MSEEFNISPENRDIILNLLQERGWPIYEYYKPSSIDRRLHTCVSICKKSNLVSYINRLRSEPEEVDTLANALLVGVTSFFRDPSVFEAVRKKVVIPLLENQKKTGDEIRVWSAACSTGQEAYSLAILFGEEAEKMKMQINMRFFASDVSSSGIHTASQGEYDEQGLDGLSEKRINRWFSQETSNSWRVKRELRRMITFVRHDLTRDPPFPRMDLIFARNLLIYLNNSGQQRLHSIFHFSLKPDGVLVVGDNEMTGNNHPLFNIVDPDNRLFVKNNDIKKDEQYHRSISVKRKADLLIFSDKKRKQHNSHRGNKYMNNQGLELTETWLSRNGQAGLLLNDEERILFTFGNIWDFIPPPRGLMTDISLHHLPCDTMRVTLREGIHRAADIQKDIEFSIVDDAGAKSVNIHIEPFKMPWGNNGYAVVFKHKDPDETQVFKPAQLNLDETTKLHIKSLEEDCARLKLELASEREQRLEDEEKLQAANEELRAANEEQQSINEELRATTDELTAKVKELTAANLEISRAHTAISGMEAEKSAILNHLSEGIIYMAPDLSCQWANPLITDSIGISDPETVRGRKCYEMIFGKDTPCDNCPAIRAINSGEVSEEMNLCLPDSRNYWLTAVPILDKNNNVVGVVEHRRDITDQTKLIEDLERSRSEYANIIQDQSEFIVRFAPDLSITFANSSFCEYSGEYYNYARSQDFHGNLSDKYREKVVKAISSLSPSKPTVTMEYPVKTRGGAPGWQRWTFRGIFDTSGKATEYQGTGLDFTDRRSLEQNLAEREQLFRGIFESSPIAIELYDKSGSLTHVNQAFLDIFKIDGGEDAVKGVDLFSDPCFDLEDYRAIRKGEIIHKEVEVDLNDPLMLKTSTTEASLKIWCDITVSPLLPVGQKKPAGFLVQVVDITKRKKAEISLRESEERIKLAVDSTGLGMWELFPESGKTVISDKLFDITGYTKETFPYSVPDWLEKVHPDDREMMKQSLQSHLNGITELYQTEFRFNHPEKGWIWLYALGSIVESDKKGTPFRMIGFNQDISDMKNIERRWREALDGVGDGIWDFRLDTNKLFLSPALYKMSGYNVNEFPASQEELQKRIHPEDQIMVQEILDAYIKEKIPEYNVEYRFMQKNGDWKWILSRGSIVERNHQGAPKRIIGTHQNITEMKSNQTRLTQYTEQLRIAQNLGRIGYFHHERNSDYLHFSDDFPHILNISTLRGNVKLSDFMKRIPLGERKDFLKRLMQVNTSKTTSTYEASLQIIDDNNELRHLQAFGRINEGEDLIYGAIQDITEKKKTELKLRDSEQQLRNIFDNAPMGIALEDSDGKITICNKVLSDILGYSEEELLMKKFHDITHPEDIEMELELFNQLSGDSPFYEITKRYIRKDGEVIWGKLRSAILESESSFCIKMVTDITEELQREAEIEKSRRAVRSLQEGLSDVTGEAFFDRLTLLLNQTLDTDVCMVTEQVPHCRDKVQTIIIRDSDNVLENFKYSLANTPCERVFSGKSFLCSSRVSEKFSLPEQINSLKVSGYIGVPLRSVNGKLLGILSVMTKNKVEHPDFIEHIMLLMASRGTAEMERQITENQLIAAREKAEASNRAKSSFLANMGHEIRTPLNAIIGYSELLAMNETNAHVKKEAKSILSAGTALLGLINNILDLSRVEAGRMMVNHTPTDTGYLVNEINSIFHQQAINKGISLKTFFDKGIPTLMLDQHRIMQILINLVGNAIKFTENGSITISINLLEKHMNSQKIKISVADTGIGIAPENLDRIFDSFEQADDTPARCYEGTGLGLAITRQLVDLMDGQIKVNSKVGEGTTFTIELIAEVVANIEPQLSFETDQKITRKFKPANILITDDNIDVLKVLRSQVESLGLTPLAASNPADSINIAKNNHIDLALLDLRLGSCNGEDLAKDLSKLENMKNVPIFAISASLDPDSRYSSEYFSEVMPKPISINTLSNFLANYLKNVQTPVKHQETKTLILDWVLPIEFHKEAQQKLSPLLDYFNGVIHVNKLKEAAKEINAFAQCKDIPKMAKMANRLVEAADNFDLKIIDNIKEKLNSVLSDDYPEI